MKLPRALLVFVVAATFALAIAIAKALFVSGLDKLPPTKVLLFAATTFGIVAALLDWALFRGLPAARRPDHDTHRARASATPATTAERPAGDPAEELLASVQASSKRSDDAHKARIRAHCERPRPQTTPAHRQQVALARSACLAIRHVFPPRFPQRSLSFLGGWPLGPDGLDWPLIHNREGLLEPLTFMGQIDLSTLPPGPARSLLPSQGVVYFFAPMSGRFGSQAHHFSVRYVAAKAGKDWGPQHNPGALEPIESGLHRRVDWMNWRDQPKRFHPRGYPRTEVELGWIDDGGEVLDSDADADTGFPWDVARRRRDRALVEFHGEAGDDSLLSPRGRPAQDPWIPFEGFPSNRRAAEVLVGYVKSWLKEERQAIAAKQAKPTLQGELGAERLEKALEHYREFENRNQIALHHILANDGHKPLRPDEKERVLALLQALRAGDWPASVDPHRYRHLSVPAVLNDWIAVAAVESAQAALADPAAADQVPQAVVQALRERHCALSRAQDGDGVRVMQHQMLGNGDVIQTAASDMPEDGFILLLQLRPDQALGLEIGDAGALQYWIHASDLSERRFEHAILTIECH